MNAWDFPTPEDQIANSRTRWGLWAERYERFLAMGPKRSLLALYNAERTSKGRLEARSVPSSWDRIAGQFDWAGRAAEYDAHLLHQKQTSRERLVSVDLSHRIQAQNDRRRLLEAGYVLMVEAIGKATEGDKTVSPEETARLLSAVARFVDVSRREFGPVLDGVSDMLEVLGEAPGDTDRKERIAAEIAAVRQVAWRSGDLGLVLTSAQAERQLYGLDAPEEINASLSVKMTADDLAKARRDAQERKEQILENRNSDDRPD